MIPGIPCFFWGTEIRCRQPIIDYLLAQRADCSAVDARGGRALHFAAAQDRLEAEDVEVS